VDPFEKNGAWMGVEKGLQLLELGLTDIQRRERGSEFLYSARRKLRDRDEAPELTELVLEGLHLGRCVIDRHLKVHDPSEPFRRGSISCGSASVLVNGQKSSHEELLVGRLLAFNRVVVRWLALGSGLRDGRFLGRPATGPGTRHAAYARDQEHEDELR